MKKKFINGILMVALMLTATTSFVSCKDNVDDEISDVYAALAKKNAELTERITVLQNQLDNLEPEVNNFITNVYEADLEEVNNKITNLQNEINDINSQLDIINGQIGDLTADIDVINGRLDDLEARMSDLEDALSSLADLLNGQFIKQVTVNQTVNSVFGTLNIPGVNVKALAALYGTNESSIDQFPVEGYDFSVGHGKFACPLEADDIADVDLVYFGDYITSSEGNAGKIYFTVNNVDYDAFDISEYDLSLENSAGKTSPVQLSNARKSNYEMSWALFARQPAYTTPLDAEFENFNGFYEADATIAAEDLEANTFEYMNTIAIPSAQVVKDIIADAKKADTAGEKKKAWYMVTAARDIAFQIYKNAFDISDKGDNDTYKPQRLVFSKTEDDVTLRMGQTGEIDILTTAIQPLSYNTFWAYENNHDDNVYTVDVFQKAIAWIADKIDQKFPNDPVDVQVVSVDVAGKTVTVKVNSVTEEIALEKEEWAQALQDEIDANGGTEAINAMIKNLLSTITLGKASQKAANRINNYLEKFSSWIIDEIQYHALTRAVAPIILFETSNGVDRLTEGMKVKAGVMNAYLTSPTLELLAPAYKKYVAVKKNGAILQSAVLDGSTQTYEFDLTETGKYQIILSCVDYYGYVVTKKYDIKVKN